MCSEATKHQMPDVIQNVLPAALQQESELSRDRMNPQARDARYDSMTSALRPGALVLVLVLVLVLALVVSSTGIVTATPGFEAIALIGVGPPGRRRSC